MQRTICELLDALSSSDIPAWSIAGRELINRADECAPFIDRIIDCLALPNYVKRDFVGIVIERMGETCMPRMVSRLEQTSGELRRVYLGLIAAKVDLPTFLLVMPRELRHGDLVSRFLAAQCIIYRLYSQADNGTLRSELMQESIELLMTSRTGPTRQEHWAHARMALKYCGVLSGNEDDYLLKS